MIGGGSAEITTPENIVVVASLTAEDIDGPALAWSIVGGADAALFRIDAASGVLSFVAAPDFEHPADSDHDNSYAVTVRASDGGAFDDQALTIAVTDVSEVPPVTVLTGTPGDDDFAAPPGSAQIDALGGDDSVTFGFRSGRCHDQFRRRCRRRRFWFEPHGAHRRRKVRVHRRRGGQQ